MDNRTNDANNTEAMEFLESILDFVTAIANDLVSEEETQDEAITIGMRGVKELAKTLRAVHESFMEVGFSDKQAFTLLRHTLPTTITSDDSMK